MTYEAIRLNRAGPAQPWGFRIHGGVDFNTSVQVVKVTPNTPASQSNLQPGMTIAKINGLDASSLKHKDAQNAILSAGNSLELAVVKGGQTVWSPFEAGGKANLKKSPAPASPAGNIGSGHNIVNKQYNTPIGMYSEENIRETLSAQAEVLNGKAIGVDFKKNEKQYDYQNSEVYKMLLEVEEEEKTGGSTPQQQLSPRLVAGHSANTDGGYSPKPISKPAAPAPAYQSIPQPMTGGFGGPPRPVEVSLPAAQPQVYSSPTANIPQPSFKPAPAAPKTAPQSIPPASSSENICSECERLIIGVFARVKDKNLHVECFKCATCGQSLKNIGYYFINEKFYCDVHAQSVARHSQPVAPAPSQPAAPFPSSISPRTEAPQPAPYTGGQIIPIVNESSSQSSNFSQSSESFVRSYSNSGSSSFMKQSEGVPSGGGFHHVQAPKPFSSPSVDQSVPMNSFKQMSVSSPPINMTNTAPSYPSYPAAPAPVNKPTVSFSKPVEAGHHGGSLLTTSSSLSKPTPPTNTATSSKGVRQLGSQAFAPKRGKGILRQPGPRIAVCHKCQSQIRGPFVTALDHFFCPSHFKCSDCVRDLIEIGFVIDGQNLFCEYCWESKYAPLCSSCSARIKNECLNAIGRSFHITCFKCAHCKTNIGKDPFFLEDGAPYCENDWNELFTIKCHSCEFPIEAGDRWVEAMSKNFHSQCFNCAACKTNLEGTSFFAKAGRPFCKAHAR